MNMVVISPFNLEDEFFTNTHSIGFSKKFQYFLTHAFLL